MLPHFFCATLIWSFAIVKLMRIGRYPDIFYAMYILVWICTRVDIIRTVGGLEKFL